MTKYYLDFQSLSNAFHVPSNHGIVIVTFVLSILFCFDCVSFSLVLHNDLEKRAYKGEEAMTKIKGELITKQRRRCECVYEMAKLGSEGLPLL